MAESTLAIAYSELIAEIGYKFGYGRTEGSWSTTQAANVAQALKRGLRNFYVHPPVPGAPRHSWRFLRPVTTISVWPTYAATTGVILDTSGTTVTADTGTTFYASMVGKTITIDGTAYVIASVTSSSVVVLTSTAGTQSDKTWAMTSDGTYQLPDGFGGLIGKMTFADSDTTMYGPLPVVGEYDIRNRQQHTDSTGRPMRVAVFSQTTQSTATVGTRWKLMVDPIPDTVYTLRYQYQILPDNITSSYAYALGGAAHSNTILEACLGAVELITMDQQGPHYQEFLRLLAASIEYDNSFTAQASFGYNGDGQSDVEPSQLGWVTYNGVQY